MKKFFLFSALFPCLFPTALLAGKPFQTVSPALPLPVSDTYVWMGQGDQTDAEYGKSVSGAGDVNGDGYDDIIVGVHYWSNPEYHEGKVVLYYGTASGINPVPAWQFESDEANATLGISVSGAGDINGDGYDDVIVGAHTYTDDLTAEGRAYVFYGSASGLPATPGWYRDGNQANDEFASSVSKAGDVNSDGYDDVIIGALAFDQGQTDEGKVFVYYGSSSGLADVSWTAEINQAGATFGSYVSDAGDVNGDGYDDVVIGARKYTNGENNEGGAFVYYGGSSGLALSWAWSGESNNIGAKYGQSVSAAGDVNKDGYDDIIVGADSYHNPETDEGKIYVYYGSTSGPATTPSFTFEPNQAGAGTGNQVANAGDVNHDGYDDIIFGSRTYDNGQADEGRVYVYYGSSAGLSATSFWYTESNQTGAFLGYSVGSAGDINNDGYDDIIAGAKYYDAGETDGGAAFVWQGGSDCTPPTGMTASSITATTVHLAWNPVAVSSLYKIWIKKTGGATSQYSSTTTYYNASGLIPASQYKAWVSAKCGSSISQKSNVVTFTTLPGKSETNENEILVYPVPANTAITIKYPFSDTWKISILNTFGEIIYSAMDENAETYIGIQNIPAGVYTIRIENETKEFRKTIIISH